MGILEIRDLTCADCIWGMQCRADSPCSDFYPTDEDIEAELLAPSKEDYSAEYITYCANAQQTNIDMRYITSFSAICKGV